MIKMCQFVKYAQQGRWICDVCGKPTSSLVFIKTVPHRNCIGNVNKYTNGVYYRCKYFGDYLREELAEACHGSKIPFDVFRCKLHKECSLLTKKRASVNILGCDKCNDFKLSVHKKLIDIEC